MYENTNSLQLLNFDNHDVRIVYVNGKPFFVGKDICDYFGDTNHKRSLGRLDSDEKTLIPILDSIGRIQQITAVNESGLYSMLFNFQPEKARKDGGTHTAPHIQERIQKISSFKRWVTHEVLPAIRKTGGYGACIADQDLIRRNIELEMANTTLARVVDALLPEGLEGLKHGCLNGNGDQRLAIIKPHARATKSGKLNGTAKDIIEASRQPILPGLTRLFGWCSNEKAVR